MTAMHFKFLGSVAMLAALTSLSGRAAQAETITYSLGSFTASAGGASLSFTGNSGSFDLTPGELGQGMTNFSFTASSSPVIGSTSDFSTTASLSIDSVAEGNLSIPGNFTVDDFSPAPGVNLPETYAAIDSPNYQFVLGDGNVLTISIISGSVPAIGDNGTAINTLYIEAGLAAPSVVPEPSSLILMGIGGVAGLIGSGYARRRRQRAATA